MLLVRLVCPDTVYKVACKRERCTCGSSLLADVDATGATTMPSSSRSMAITPWRPHLEAISYVKLKPDKARC